MWAGGTESQFVVVRKFIHDSHNTCLKFNIRVKLQESYFLCILCLVVFLKGLYLGNDFLE